MPVEAGGEYALGRSQREYARLARQAEIVEPMTRRVFADAGIVSGMRVLDLGSGAGDVCLLLAELVGPTGVVIGLEHDESAVRFATERAARAGLPNVRFVHSDFSSHIPETTVDAIVGRLVLLYQADPVAALAAVAKHLRPGGVVAFMEPLFMPPQGPDSTLKLAMNLILETLRRSGAHLDIGVRLHRVFTAAGLPLPAMRFEALVDGSDDSPLYQYLADTLASVLPKAISYGLPGAAEIDVDTIAERARAEMKAVGYAMVGLPLVAAWCRTA